MSEEYPNLAGVATKNLVETKGGGSFSASYINWSRTMQLLREHAPGWSIESLESPVGGIVFKAPVGGYLMIRIRHCSGAATPAVPQAIMDNRNNSVPFDKITSRDITDTHRRGACMALALHFGLAYELWAKDPLESGYSSTVVGSDVKHITKSDVIVEEINDVPKPMTEQLAEALKRKTPDPSRPVGNVYEAIERIKNCKTEKGATKSLEDSIWKYRFSKNDRGQMNDALEYKVNELKKEKEGEA